jgi:hypothetical protein
MGGYLTFCLPGLILRTFSFTCVVKEFRVVTPVSGGREGQ